jgi:adiponectin receptor
MTEIYFWMPSGCVAFLGVGAFFLSCSEEEIRNEDKVVFSAFFTGACVCLGLSTCFHTFLCHSEWAGQLFSKLDYVGIALLIMGSFVPWLYYSFYCDFWPRIVYVCVEIVLGLSSIIISLWPRFGEPRYRFLRAGSYQSYVILSVGLYFLLSLAQASFWALDWVEWFLLYTIQCKRDGSKPWIRPR